MNGEDYYTFLQDYLEVLRKALGAVTVRNCIYIQKIYRTEAETKLVDYLENEIKLMEADRKTCFVDEI